ncbi:MAG: restriction endonuclease subunit S [Burkholderiales bacterium]|nr:restriction endonuclease subunit S [Burkholderiales bacterium]
MSFSKHNWNKVNLSKICDIDPSKKEIASIPNETIVSFAEMADLNIKKPEFCHSQEKSIQELKKNGLSYFKDNDVLLAKMTPCFENGKSGLANNLKNGVGFGSTEFFVLRSKGINPYLLYSIISSDLFIENGKKMMLGTTGRKRLIKDFIANFELPLPGDDEQRKLTTLFKSIDASIEQCAVQENKLKVLLKSLANNLLAKEPLFGNLLNVNNCHSSTMGQIAECDKKYPEHAVEVTKFVGLEHIEAENFQVQGYGNIADGTTFTKKFVAGDILFGKRRAYLKKIAIADFDGVCSNDILVIRAKGDKILQELLPFYIASDAFIQVAINTSAGSLSPRTKWKDLSDMEISIPSIEMQHHVLSVLQQINIIIIQIKQQKQTLKNLKQKLLNEILG